MTIDLAKLRAETLALLDGTTPGPWHQANGSEIHDRSVKFGAQGERLGDTPMLIAEAYWPHANANARLIAAAPTLAANTLRLLDEIERLRAEADAQRERAEEAEAEITRAQELVSAEFEGDCWKTLRALLDRTGYDWTLYGDDGVSADDAFQWIVEELDRLETERDAAWQAGAEAMRKAAANVASNTCLVPPDGGSPTEEERVVCEEVCRRVLALPLPRQPKENDA